MLPEVSQETFDSSILAGLVAKSSLAMYTRDFKAYLAFVQQPTEAVKAQTLARWRAHLANETRYAAATINRMLSSVRTLMNEAEEQGYVPAGTAQAFKRVRDVRVVAMKDRQRQHNRIRLSPEQMRRIADSPNPLTLRGLRDRALLHTWGSSGLRVEELVTLTLAQLSQNDQGYQLKIQGKNDTEPRYAPLSQEAYQYLSRWISARQIFSAYIFTSFAGRGDRENTTHLNRASVWKIVRAYAKQCGIAHVKPHDGRRFVGTQLAKENPRKAQKALGHKHIDTTMRNYVLDDLETGITDNLF